jgi:hypothetical protein
MAWESRHDSRHSYYYRKKRVAGRVVSEYIGRGEVAALIARDDELDRLKAGADRAQRRTERASAQVLDAELDALEQELATLTTGALLCAGYHLHKGQWRKRRT